MLFFPECSTVIRGAPRRSQVCRRRSQVLSYATRPVAWAMGSVYFSVRGYEVPSQPSEPSGTPGCFRRKLELLLMQSTSFSSKSILPQSPRLLRVSQGLCISVTQLLPYPADSPIINHKYTCIVQCRDTNTVADGGAEHYIGQQL